MKVPKLQLRKLNVTENALLIDDKRFVQSLLKAFNDIDVNGTNVDEEADRDNRSERLETNSMGSVTRRNCTKRGTKRGTNRSTNRN